MSNSSFRNPVVWLTLAMGGMAALASANEIVLGSFVDRAHDVAGQVVALSDRVLEVRGFGYDGSAPDAFFWSDTNAVPSENGFILLDAAPTSNCGVEKLGFADGTVTQRVEFPEGSSLYNITGGSISVWCRAFRANFGELVIPSKEELAGLSAAADGPSLECSEGVDAHKEDITATPEGYNCEPLHEDFQVRWKVDGDELAVELVGFIDDNDYLGFGVSGSDAKTEMIGADVIVTDLYNETFRAVDYYMSARAQCSTGAGVCPDTQGAFTNGATNVTGARDSGVTVVRYRRPLLATDATALVSGAAVDRNISVVPGESTFIAWAIGPVSQDTGFPNFHSVAYTPGDVTLEFGRAVVDNCEPLVDTGGAEEEIDAFERPVMRGETQLYTAIGPSGGDRGYLGITGRVGWGIAWYINEVLLPVIEMERGTTYTFSVNGGDVPTDSANYHPMYLTTSISGGYAQVTEEERSAEQIFGGLTVGTSFQPTAVGPICKFESTDSTAAAMLNGTYQDFINSLDTSCTEDSAILNAAAILEFTPDENTPDLLYYQCVTHRNLGWEIRVVDAGETYTENTAVGKSGNDEAEQKPKGEASEEQTDASGAGIRGLTWSIVLAMAGFWMI